MMKTMTTTTDTITDTQISTLRTEAAAAGDTEQVRLCELALDGDTYSVVYAGRMHGTGIYAGPGLTAAEAESRASDLRAEQGDAEIIGDARSECEQAIRSAAAMPD